MSSKPLIATAPLAKTDERITELHLWAVHEGLRRTPTATLFEDFCRRLVDSGVPVWRAFAGMRTLHPQWAGYTYTWWRDRNEVDPTRRERAKSMSGIYGTAPMPICAMSPLGETCRCACGVG